MTWRTVRGLVHVRMHGFVLLGVRRPGHILHRIRDDERPPPVGAEAWKPANGKWSEDFGGRWLEKGTRQLSWEWF